MNTLHRVMQLHEKTREKFCKIDSPLLKELRHRWESAEAEQNGFEWAYVREKTRLLCPGDKLYVNQEAFQGVVVYFQGVSEYGSILFRFKTAKGKASKTLFRADPRDVEIAVVEESNPRC